ncbi:MAG: 3-dehydroquinate synthase [Flavobacteriales bacterium]|nr:3-dehydroquinate synthase [Flavobacteriales bacterium]
MNDSKIEDVSLLDHSWEPLLKLLKENERKQVFVLVDSNTSLHCLPQLELVLENEQIQYSILEVEAGETSKGLEVCASLWNALTEEQASRQSLLINLGGGMITDLGGFVAAVYKRGIEFINIPTSLLGMIDASIGGKCGIDFNGYKNQLGAFQTPQKTFIYPSFLKTLPKDELKSGYAEVIKHALIADQNYWEELEQSNLSELPDVAILQRSIEIKSSIVAADPLEKGERKKLNFGHTIGHAFESYFLEKGNPIPHGFAIAAGMFCEAKLSVMVSTLLQESLEAILAMIDKNYQRLQIDSTDFTDLIELMKQDKKNQGAQINCTLLSGIGIATIDQEIEDELILETLKFYFRS